MADRVVIVGVTRGGAKIHPSELRQMMGRAGRRHGGEAVVELIVDEANIPVLDDMLTDEAVEVRSAFSNPDLVALALMPEIDRGAINSVESAKVWCSRSMCERPAVEGAIELLREVGAINGNDDLFRPTEVGTCASRFYFHPADVAAWKENFEQLLELGLEDDDVAAAWALGSVPFDRIVGDVGEHREALSDCIHRIPMGLQTIEGSKINVFGWWSLMGGPPAGPIRPACLERRKNFGRYKAALKGLNDAYGWDASDFLDEVELRVRKGVSWRLVPMCRFKGITKSKAEHLYDLGIRSVHDFERALEMIDDEEFCDALRRAIGTPTAFVR